VPALLQYDRFLAKMAPTRDHLRKCPRGLHHEFAKVGL